MILGIGTSRGAQSRDYELRALVPENVEVGAALSKGQAIG